FLQQPEPLPHSDSFPNLPLPRPQPPAIADHCVDFAVVRNISKRLRKLPGGLCICGVSLVENCKLRSELFAAQIFVEPRELPRCEQPLVNDSAGRERTQVTALRKRSLGSFAQKPKAALKFLRKVHSRISRTSRFNKKLPDFRHRLKRSLPQCVWICRNPSPSHQPQFAPANRILYSGTRIRNPRRWSKEHAHAKQFVQVDFVFGSTRPQETHRQAC